MKTNRSQSNTDAGFRVGSFLAAVLLCLAIVSPPKAGALGTRIPNQDAEATGRANAFVATADNPSAIYYNPAGITQLDGDNFQVGFHAISVNSFFNSPTGGSSESEFSLQAVPQVYYTHHVTGLKDDAGNAPITLGLGIYAPYGLGIIWPDGSSFRQTTTFLGKLLYLTINPVIGYKVNDQFSLAIGPTINYSQVLLREGVPVPGIGEFKFRGNDYDFGFKAGAMWQPCEHISVGASYQSGTSMNYHGSASTLTANNDNASAELPFAQFAIGGISFRPTPKWNIEADADWTNWRMMKSTTFINTPLNNVPFRFDWHDSWMLGIGATRYLDGGYYVSCGYFYSEKSTTDFDFIPVVPDQDLHVGCLGLGYKGEKWSWALSGQFITGPDRNISNNQNPTVDGRYQFVNAAVNVSLARHF